MATVAGDPVKASELDEHLQEDLAKLDRDYAKNRFDMRRKGLDAIVFRKLVVRESARLGVDAEAYIEREIELRLKVATEEEARVFFDENQTRLGAAPFEEVKERIVDFMTTQRRSEVILAIYAELKAKSEVRFFLDPPASERRDVGSEGASIGDKDAPIVIVAYSDFQCPYCSRARAVVAQVLTSYTGKVRVVFRHFPLPFHEHAFKAAEAAECANDQGKFWALHDHMFEHQDALDVASLKAAARRLGLDGPKFDGCLDEARHKERVAESVAGARAFGVEGTPHFFINGLELTGAQPFERFRDVIEAELRRGAKR